MVDGREGGAAQHRRAKSTHNDHQRPTTPPTFTNQTKQALRAAEAYGRRAILLRWGLELERVPLEELLVRNALRATRLGRYIPAVSVKVCVCIVVLCVM